MKDRSNAVCGPMRYVMLGLGLVCTLIGVAGVILPGLPGTVFLLIAVWAFSRSSERLHVWLFDHPRFGRPIRDWHQHRVIPRKAKVLAVTMMAGSFITVLVSNSGTALLPVVVGGVLFPTALWIATRRSSPPSQAG